MWVLEHYKIPLILQYSFTPFCECVGIPSYWVQFAQQPATEEGHVPLVQGHSDQVRGHMTITMTSLLQPLLHAKHSIGDCLSPPPPPPPFFPPPPPPSLFLSSFSVLQGTSHRTLVTRSTTLSQTCEVGAPSPTRRC